MINHEFYPLGTIRRPKSCFLVSNKYSHSGAHQHNERIRSATDRYLDICAYETNVQSPFLIAEYIVWYLNDGSFERLSEYFDKSL